MRFETKAIHAGRQVDPVTGAVHQFTCLLHTNGLLTVLIPTVLCTAAAITRTAVLWKNV